MFGVMLCEKRAGGSRPAPHGVGRCTDLGAVGRSCRGQSKGQAPGCAPGCPREDSHGTEAPWLSRLKLLQLGKPAAGVLSDVPGPVRGHAVLCLVWFYHARKLPRVSFMEETQNASPYGVAKPRNAVLHRAQWELGSLP